ncbi:MAG: hypothetical protein FIB07_07920 [Candidatus Methanoperedens sp.]|nr:hypothetical protein [Candidatus Methanoperedens sp.]
MKYLPVILVILFFLIPGCLQSSDYKDISRSQLLSDPAAFEGKKICTDLIYENNGFPGINVIRNQNFTSDLKNATLATVCGIYKSDRIEPDSVNPILAVATQKDVYYSNETLRVHIDFYSQTDGNGKLGVSGIRNDFDRPLINKTQDITFVKGINGFDLEFTTPSCEECSALSPGEYAINATVTVNDNIFETYKKVTLARNNTNISKNGSGILQSNNTVAKEQLNDTRVNEIKEYNAQTTSTYGTLSNQTILVEYFYITGCQKCEQATPVVEALMKSYGSRVKFVKYNAREEERDLAIQYSIPGTPSIVINKDSKNLISYDNYNGDTAKLESILKEAIDKATILQQAPEIVQSDTLVLSVPSVFLVGFLAGFNPCLLAILAFIASVTLATTGKRRNVLLIVLMFSLGIFVTYLIVGIGLLRILEEAPGLQAGIKNFLVVLIGILGLWHVYDAYHLRKNTESSFYTPKAFIRLTESVTKNVSLPASFFMGALFSLIKAPCVGAVYFLILDMVRRGEGAGYLYLAAYNFGVVLPVLVLGGAIAFGLDPGKVEKFRKDKRSLMRLITGVTLLAIAVLMYMGII